MTNQLMNGVWPDPRVTVNALARMPIPNVVYKCNCPRTLSFVRRYVRTVRESSRMFQQQLSLRQHRCEDEKSGGCCDPGTVGGKLISAAQGSQPGRLFEAPAFWLVL